MPGWQVCLEEDRSGNHTGTMVTGGAIPRTYLPGLCPVDRGPHEAKGAAAQWA